ncbi:MAG: pimeloyl-ACP methyl ester esterase BioH [Pseudomonadota bacterium]
MSLPRPVLALVHGWGMNARVFDALAARLADDFDVRAHDLPGHGGRGALPDNALAAWAGDLAQRLPDGATLVGWSLGGQVALRAALDHPRRVARLVLLASTPKFLASDDWDHGMAPDDLDAFANALRAEPDKTLLRFLSLQTRGMDDQKALLHALRERLFAAPPASDAALAAGLAILRDADLRADAENLAQPALVVHGALDTLTPRAAGAWLAAALPQARHVEIARAAHAPHLSHSDEVAAAIRRFVHG